MGKDEESMGEGWFVGITADWYTSRCRKWVTKLLQHEGMRKVLDVRFENGGCLFCSCMTDFEYVLRM
jgi:hypothetical protein